MSGPTPITPPTHAFEYFCARDPSQPSFSFCAPNSVRGHKESFYAVVPASADPAAVLANIRARFRNQDAEIKKADAVPEGIELSGTEVLLDVTKFLPTIAVTNNGEPQNYPGPNCYYAALVSAGLITDEPRYVDSVEFSYYITRFMQPASLQPLHSMKLGEMAIPYGAVLVFSGSQFSKSFISGPALASADFWKSPLETNKRLSHLPRSAMNSRCQREKCMAVPEMAQMYDSGAHAAFVLSPGVIFHKRGYNANDPYEAARASDSMQLVDLSEYLHMDKFERLGRKPPEKVDYPAHVFIKRPIDLHQRFLYVDPKRAAYYTTLFSLYSGLLESAPKICRSDFERTRLDLLTIESVWQLCRKFEEELLGRESRRLLDIEPSLVMAYLKLKSLSWQYQAMTDEYTKNTERESNYIRYAEYVKLLYKEHYLTNDAFLNIEIDTHLKASGTPEPLWPSIRSKTKEAVAKDLPSVVARASEGFSIDLFKKIDEAIASSIPSR